MQSHLALPADLSPLRDRLRAVFGSHRPEHRLDPVSQLIKAMLGVRTYDDVTWAAFVRLRAAYADWNDLVTASTADLEPLIDPVTFADQKARQLPILIRVILLKRGALNLDFLATEPVDEALAWLMRLPGVGLQAASMVLNFSTLNRRALVVDSHLHRVARRLGLTARTGDERQTQESLMADLPSDWGPEQVYELHWLLKPHGQSICTHFEPACGLCALRDICPRVGVTLDQQNRVLTFES